MVLFSLLGFKVNMNKSHIMPYQLIQSVK